jgi:hypothetical protein
MAGGAFSVSLGRHAQVTTPRPIDCYDFRMDCGPLHCETIKWTARCQDCQIGVTHFLSLSYWC